MQKTHRGPSSSRAAEAAAARDKRVADRKLRGSFSLIEAVTTETSKMTTKSRQSFTIKKKCKWKLAVYVHLLAVALISCAGRLSVEAGHSRRSSIHSTQAASISSTGYDADPMEPCYLANNRASESLTISESTPVGTVVGELMVSFSPTSNFKPRTSNLEPQLGAIMIAR